MQGARTKIRLRRDRFRELASRRCETVDDVAQAAGVDRFNLYRLLRGEHTPTVATRKKLLRHFKTDFDGLFVIVDGQESSDATAG
jgi:DNA-binding XRE family transcriptional regulator